MVRAASSATADGRWHAPVTTHRHIQETAARTPKRLDACPALNALRDARIPTGRCTAHLGIQ